MPLLSRRVKRHHVCSALLSLLWEWTPQARAAPAAWTLDEGKTGMKTKPREQAADPEVPQPRCEQEANILGLSSWDLMVLIGTASPGGNCTEYAECGRQPGFLFYWWLGCLASIPIGFFSLLLKSRNITMIHLHFSHFFFIFFLRQSKSFQFAYSTLHFRQVFFYRDGCYFHY